MDMDDVDAALGRLARTPTPPGLRRLEGAVLERVALDRPIRQKDMLGLCAATAAFALVMGVAGGVLPGESEAAHAPRTSLTGVAELVPSALLAGR